MGRVGGKNAALPLSLMSVFTEACPQYLAMGMSYEQYWDGDVYAHKAYRKAKKMRMREQNQIAWLQGMYVYEAIADLAPALKAFAKGKPRPYSKEPYDLFKEDIKAREEREAKERYERIKANVAAFAKRQKERQQESVKGVDEDARCIP